MESPSRAAAKELMPTEPPKIQRPTVTAKAPAVIFSSRERGPSFSSSFLASLGASGVSFISVTNAVSNGERRNKMTDVTAPNSGTHESVGR